MELHGDDPVAELSTSSEAIPPSSPSTTTTTPSTSALVTIPGELRNTILDLILPTNSKVFVFASTNYDIHPHRHYKYWQFVPSVLQTCHQLRADGLARYYSSNTFRFTRRMLDPPLAFDGFLHVRRWGIEHLQRVEITHCVSITFACRLYRHPSEPVDEYDGLAWLAWEDWDVSFVAAAAATGAASLEVTVLSTEQRGRWTYRAGERKGLCCCALKAMAKATPVRPGAVVGLLREYFDQTDAYSKVVRERIRDGAGKVGAKICWSCRKCRGI